ncbi:unnamed protein product [Chondrus crispus]|uniref:RecA family profile 1 domain-containing protein n=1 Tax=Chondrus crispus TaxID=2769 RepID=R7QLQ9_CHOCR|nr:unnamed protein product [Chondrus crispus]CDF39004.1 unnamed protein product [Chondrus crispus]|eukprot:XP_005718909.1 unnamed protein product [Chondrus crispus]
MTTTNTQTPTAPSHSDDEAVLISKAQTILAARGAASILEELSRPVIGSFPPALLPYLSTAALEAQGLSAPVFRPFHSFLQSPTTFSTSCVSLDRLLRGGIPLGTASIVELSGVAGAGKTQILLQLSLMAGAPVEHGGAATGAIVAFTEGAPPIARMHQIEAHLCDARGLPAGTLLRKVVVEQVRSVDQLLNWAQHRLPYLFRQTGATVVVVDSVAAVYRPEFDDALSRAEHLVALAAALKRAAAHVGGVCVCANQVSQGLAADGTLNRTVPALGAAWSNCVDTRVFLRRAWGGSGGRIAKVLHSSFLGTVDGGEEYQVTSKGVVGG